MVMASVIIVDNEKNDDWMKALPGYADEVKIIESALHPKGKVATVSLKQNMPIVVELS